MRKFNYAKALKEANIAYLGGVKNSTKLVYSYNHGWLTYGIYLAPSTLARDEFHPHINMCPFSANCKDACLHGAGQNKMSTIKANHIGEKWSHITDSRIRKTHLYFDNRELFMDIMIHEIQKWKRYADKHNLHFAVRLNCTSDISLETLVKDGKNILEIFPHIQFYDYTKVPSHLALADKYPNYDLTFSFDGSNWDECKKYLDNGGKVAVVFDYYDDNNKQILPSYWKGYEVINANDYDMRFLDPKGTIMGLHYHRVANDYKNGKYVPNNSPFIVRPMWLGRN